MDLIWKIDSFEPKLEGLYEAKLVAITFQSFEASDVEPQREGLPENKPFGT